jgi:pyruvate/2-oxoglutarate dehydrogenase complex dihydrolipoamide dehydrogenase (E3) component
MQWKQIKEQEGQRVVEAKELVEKYD